MGTILAPTGKYKSSAYHDITKLKLVKIIRIYDSTNGTVKVEIIKGETYRSVGHIWYKGVIMTRSNLSIMDKGGYHDESYNKFINITFRGFKIIRTKLYQIF